MASQVVQLYNSNSFCWCVTSSLGTQYDSFSIEPRSFRQTFWLLLTKQCKKKPQYLSYLSDISFVISMGKMTKRQRNNRFLLYLSFILYYPVICRYPDWRVHAYFISWEQIVDSYWSQQINGVDIVLSSRLLNIRVPKKIIFLRVKM